MWLIVLLSVYVLKLSHGSHVGTCVSKQLSGCELENANRKSAVVDVRRLWGNAQADLHSLPFKFWFQTVVCQYFLLLLFILFPGGACLILIGSFPFLDTSW